MRHWFQAVLNERRVADAPRFVWRDPIVVGAGGVGAVVEASLRPELPWRWLTLALALPLIACLPLRRTHPLAVVVVCFGGMTALSVADLILRPAHSPGLGTMALLLITLYAAARWGSGPEALTAAAIGLVTSTVAITADYTGIGEAIGGVALLELTFATGLAVRFRSRARQREFEQIRFDERAQLARDLHDTVAHHVSAIAIRAQAGLAVAPSRPGAAVEALRLIETEATRTLAEMRAMVGVLRRDNRAELAPTPTLADLHRLAVQPPGQPAVSVTIGERLDDVAPAVSAGAFRIAQEAVTNAQRHARNATQITVLADRVASVDSGTCRLRLSVVDDGERVERGRPTHGYGLIGIAERAELLGGRCTAGPRDSRGWSVDVELPLTELHR